MKGKNTDASALGVMVTSRAVHAALVKSGPDGPVVLGRFTRQRAAKGAGGVPGMAPGGMMPEMQESAGASDFTLQFGDSGGMSGGVGAAGGVMGSTELFMSSEFGDGDGDEKGGQSAPPEVQSFTFELNEILQECKKGGYPEPTLAFCASTGDITHVELQIGAAGKKKPDAANGPAKEGEPAEGPRIKQEQLLAALAAQHKGEIQKERVAFMRMLAGNAGGSRYLALLPKASEPISPTLLKLRDKLPEMPPIRALDAEVSLYLGLARSVVRSRADETGDAYAPPPHQACTLVVRAAAEDTLVLFLKGEHLQHYESLRSLTTYDSPETICSRVLLQQDEYGIDEVTNVLLLSEERENDLIESFQMFFPEARVGSMRDHMPPSAGSGGEVREMQMVAATIAALRALPGSRMDVFEEVNLLPRKLLRRRIKVPFTWHTAAVAALILVTLGFFSMRYLTQSNDIEDVRDRLRAYPPNLADMDTRALQARIDSLQSAYVGYMHALDVLDTLLMGSDQWSRSLAQVSREAAGVQGVWIERWSPERGSVELAGSATSRDRVVALAEQLRGNIEVLTFSEIRDWPVYSFVMTFPVERDLPEAAKFLRERVSAELARQDTPQANESASVQSAALKNQ